MARRTLTIKRIDPWSVLKVGFLANLVLLGILLLAGRVTWFFIERLELIDRACEVASSVGFQDCGLNGGNIFRNALLLGLLGVVVQTGILVFGSFLHNLISELTGGLSFTVVDDGPDARAAGTASQRTGRPAEPQRPGRAAAAGAAGAAGAAAGAATSRVAEKASEVRARTIAETPRPTPRPTPGSGGGQPAAPRPGAPSTPSPSAPSQGAPSPSAPSPGAPTGAGAPSQPSAQPRPGGLTRPDAPNSSQPGQARPAGPQDPTQVQRPVDRDLFRGDA